MSAVSQDGENPRTSDLAGLYKRSPLLALLLLFSMFGLAGIPPTPGLAGKWFLFTAIIESGELWLVLVAAVNATISLYYYLLVVKSAYLAPPESDEPLRLSSPYRALALCALAIILILGVYPGPLWTLATEAGAVLFP